MSRIDELERIVAPVVSSAGLELVDVEMLPAPRVLRVRVDGPDGVDLDSLGPLSKSISRLIDESDAVPGGHYELEISSPGLERPLRRPEHFRRALGSQVKVKTRPGTDGDRRVEGTLSEADDTGVVIVVDGTEGAGRRIAYEEIDRAHTVFDWQAALAADARAHAAPRRARRGPGRAEAGGDAPGATEPETGKERAEDQ